jgi:radical SAM superfamily enzyme YgiQ (UPF0313 family)
MGTNEKKEIPVVSPLIRDHSCQFVDNPSAKLRNVDIVLTTLNARYAHAAFGLRYLRANLGPDLIGRSEIVEFDISQRTLDILENLLARNPRIVGMGVYIWNVQQCTQLAAELKRLRPEILLVLGGPEISYEIDQQEIARFADFIVTGEGDLAFADLCRKLLAGNRPLMNRIPGELPEFSRLALPYQLYTDTDLAHRVVYVEASRGCPFKCEFCLSSLDVPVRNVPLDPFLNEMQRLLDRGLRQFKFVDRTFNLNLNFSRSILQFFYDRFTPGLFLHFEMIPDRLPEALRDPIRQFPPGALQFEVGIQTFNEAVAARISRRQDAARVEDNLRFLRDETGVHVHADLIAGLPGEDVASFGRGFDRLVALRPHEIQVGILKRLRGTPIVRHDAEWGMIYSPNPPYEILQTNLIDFSTMQRVRRFSRYWDLIANSGNFPRTIPLIWEDASPFDRFMELSDWLYHHSGKTHAISLLALAEMLFNFLSETCAAQRVAEAIWADYTAGGRSDRPKFLQAYVGDRPIPRRKQPGVSAGPSRQHRHLIAAQPASPPETASPPN